MGDIVGCDISKGWVDIDWITGDEHRTMRIANREASIQRFATQLPPGSTIGMEATAQMHELLADTLVALGHRVFVVNPRWIHNYGKSVGLRGKTDRSDAALIARFVAAEGSSLRPYVPPTPQQRELRSLLLRRLQAVKLRTATRQSFGTQATDLVAHFNIIIADLERRIRAILASRPDWLALAQRLATQPGIGRIVAAHLVQVLERFPFSNADAFVAHLGLDPRPNDSGRRRGRRRLSHHGDASLRTMLFLAAMTACRQPEWRSLYELQRSKGLPSTAALIVVARKLARTAFALFRSGRDYDASCLGVGQAT